MGAQEPDGAERWHENAPLPSLAGPASASLRGARWRAGAELVRAATGFAIGGVAPVGHPAPLETLVDEDRLAQAVVWAAAGTPTDVFAVAPDDLVRLTEGRVVAVRA